MMTICDGGHEIAYDDRGSGLPVIFLPGFPHDRALWAQQLDGLADHARCIAPDLRGFGGSGRRGPFSMDQYADDLACLMDHLELPQAVVAGVSMGGYVALAFWRRHPDRVRALILSDTRAGADDDAGKDRRRELIALANDAGPRAVAAQMLDGMVGRSTRERSPEVVVELQRLMDRAPAEGVIGALEAMIDRPDSTPDLATITVPTLVIAGAEDVVIPPRESRALQAAIAGSQLEILAGAGHVPNVERPAAFNHVVGEFISRLQLA
ncbi:MAG: alpha/beta fold hydrolase [Gemmatimonadaceae bacterium]